MLLIGVFLVITALPKSLLPFVMFTTASWFGISLPLKSMYTVGSPDAKFAIAFASTLSAMSSNKVPSLSAYINSLLADEPYWNPSAPINLSTGCNIFANCSNSDPCLISIPNMFASNLTNLLHMLSNIPCSLGDIRSLRSCISFLSLYNKFVISSSAASSVGLGLSLYTFKYWLNSFCILCAFSSPL